MYAGINTSEKGYFFSLHTDLAFKQCDLYFRNDWIKYVPFKKNNKPKLYGLLSANITEVLRRQVSPL